MDTRLRESEFIDEPRVVVFVKNEYYPCLTHHVCRNDTRPVLSEVHIPMRGSQLGFLRRYTTGAREITRRAHGNTLRPQLAGEMLRKWTATYVAFAYKED
jgi:hypothetical protein